MDEKKTAARCSSAERDEERPHWDERLFALTDGAATRPRLRSVTAAAARDGVRAGMSLSEARALCARLEVASWNDSAVNSGITRATAMFVEASPQVTPVRGSPGMWWIGASGFAAGAHVSGGGSELSFATALAARARRWHPDSRVSIADTCVAARAATWSSRRPEAPARICVIPPGGDAAYLHSAPLILLPMDDEMRDTLRALGIRTVGAFADLGAGDVEQRWGDEGLAAWRLAHGEDPRRPVLARLDRTPHVEMELTTPAATMEPVLFLVRPAVERLVAQLVSEARAIASLAITLTLDDARGPLPTAQAHTVTREIRLPRPLARPAPLFERCRGLLARWTLTAPVTAIRVTVLITSPLSGDQGNLLDTSWRDPGAADAALERVRAELGSDVVVKAAARDGYAPERSGSWREETEAFSLARRVGASSPHPPSQQHSSPTGADNVLRLLETPEKVDVDRDDQPRRIVWRGRPIPVVNAIGPERLSSDWWNDGYSRDYWRCENHEECGDLVLYRDAAGWWVQGWYD